MLIDHGYQQKQIVLWKTRNCHQNVEGPAEVSTQSSTACGGGKHMHRSESTYAQLVYMMSTIVTHNRLCDGYHWLTQKCYLCTGNLQSKTQLVEGKFSIV